MELHIHHVLLLEAEVLWADAAAGRFAEEAGVPLRNRPMKDAFLRRNTTDQARPSRLIAWDRLLIATTWLIYIALTVNNKQNAKYYLTLQICKKRTAQIDHYFRYRFIKDYASTAVLLLQPACAWRQHLRNASFIFFLFYGCWHPASWCITATLCSGVWMGE